MVRSEIDFHSCVAFYYFSVIKTTKIGTHVWEPVSGFSNIPFFQPKLLIMTNLCGQKLRPQMGIPRKYSFCKNSNVYKHRDVNIYLCISEQVYAKMCCDGVSRSVFNPSQHLRGAVRRAKTPHPRVLLRSNM